MSSEERKNHHLDLARKAQVSDILNSKIEDDYKILGRNPNELFDYEPLLNGFKKSSEVQNIIKLGDRQLNWPIWISSMTGGSNQAAPINKLLAQVCSQFGLGLGLGSCRMLIDSDEFLSDFQLRPIIGDAQPLFANFGLAQLIEAYESSKISALIEVAKKLEADGIFIHINPLQEYFQPEGDRWSANPFSALKEFQNICAQSKLLFGVKEVGQGMGPASLSALWEMEIDILEFAAYGGTNFSALERLRKSKSSESIDFDKSEQLCFVGHSAIEMVRHVNRIAYQNKNLRAPLVIASGGVRSALGGYYLNESLQMPSCYAMALPFLEHAQKGIEPLRRFVRSLIETQCVASSFLKVRQVKEGI